MAFNISWKNGGFQVEDLDRFEDRGCVQQFPADVDPAEFFPEERPESLPAFVPGHNIFERGGKCLGVLDGTSHFIELFQVERILDVNQAKHPGYFRA